MSKKLVCLIQRHGETVLNADNKFRSILDPALNKKGHLQAEAAARHISKHYSVNRVVTSPLLRAVETAATIAGKYGLEVEQDRGMLPWELGFLAGRDKEEYGPILEFFVDNPKLAIPDGQSLDEFEERVFDFFSKQFRKQVEDKVPVFVGHTSNLVMLENLILGRKDKRPESGEAAVGPGGTAAIYTNEDGGYDLKVVFGQKQEAEFGQ